MKEKRNIDDLFRERLGQFESSPPPEAWDNIRAALDKKKRRRVIPIWWRAAGVAALLALLLTIGNVLLDDPLNTGPSLTQEEVAPTTNDAQGTPIDEQTTIGGQEGVADQGDAASDQEGVDDRAVKDKRPEKSSENTRLANRDSEAAPEKGNTDNDPVVRGKQEIPEKQTGIADVLPKTESAEKIPATESQKRDDKADTQLPDNDRIAVPEPETGIAGQDTDKTRTDVEKDLNKLPVEAQEELVEEEKQSIYEAIAEQEEVQDKEIEAPRAGNRWEVTPIVGPVYYSSLGEGSSIDPSFADNSQTGEVNFSYGAQVSYAISDKLSLRTGVHNVNLGYSTGDVELGTGPVGSALKSVDYGNQGVVTTAVDKGSLSTGNPDNGPFGDITPKSAGAEAFINQSLRYFEVPLELRYTFVESRLGVHVIGGFSSLFLADNEVSVEAGDFNTVLGEANNLNSLSFTTNIGLGFDYRLGKKLKFNIEPMFKYQLNPYTDSSVDFNPFYMGIYTGLSFRF